MLRDSIYSSLGEALWVAASGATMAENDSCSRCDICNRSVLVADSLSRVLYAQVLLQMNLLGSEKRSCAHMPSKSKGNCTRVVLNMTVCASDHVCHLHSPVKSSARV